MFDMIVWSLFICLLDINFFNFIMLIKLIVGEWLLCIGVILGIVEDIRISKVVFVFLNL